METRVEPPPTAPVDFAHDLADLRLCPRLQRESHGFRSHLPSGGPGICEKKLSRFGARESCALGSHGARSGTEFATHERRSTRVVNKDGHIDRRRSRLRSNLFIPLSC